MSGADFAFLFEYELLEMLSSQGFFQLNRAIYVLQTECDFTVFDSLASHNIEQAIVSVGEAVFFGLWVKLRLRCTSVLRAACFRSKATIRCKDIRRLNETNRSRRIL